MEVINIEDYIKDLSPELQEKARACRSTDELLKLAEENSIPIPDDAVEAVAGGNKLFDTQCPARKDGGKHDFKSDELRTSMVAKCKYCGKEILI